MVPRLVLFSWSLALLACSFQGGVAPGLQCGEGDSCPAGQVCQAEYCVEPGGPVDAHADADAGADAGIVPDAAPPDGSPPTARCGTLSLLRDDFEDGLAGGPWYGWADSSVTRTESGGVFQVEIPQGTADDWGGRYSNAAYDFTDGALSAEVLEVGGVSTILEVFDTTGVAVQIYVEAGDIIAAVWQGPLAGQRASQPYMLETHRYWRLRESGGVVFWETSPDRITWNVLHSEASPIALEDVFGGIWAGGQLASGPSRARFGDVNLDAPAGLVHCPGTDLVDSFEDGVIDPGLRPIVEVGCTVTETGGALNISFDTTGNDRCQVKSEHLFDVRESEVRIDVGGAYSGPETFGWLQLEHRVDDTRLEIQVHDGGLEVGQRVSGVDVDLRTVPFDPVAHRWWRIRGAAGRVYLETSPDGTTWTTRLDTTPQLDLSQVRLELGAETRSTSFPLVLAIAALNSPS